MSESKKNRIIEALHWSVRAGVKILESGGSSVDAVEAAVCVLEDCEYFNAGKGFNN
jgi:beta-aspartyl-peptidase (threonine type)